MVNFLAIWPQLTYVKCGSTLFVLFISCDSKCSMALSHIAEGLSAVCDYGIS